MQLTSCHTQCSLSSGFVFGSELEMCSSLNMQNILHLFILSFRQSVSCLAKSLFIELYLILLHAGFFARLFLCLAQWSPRVYSSPWRSYSAWPRKPNCRSCKCVRRCGSSEEAYFPNYSFKAVLRLSELSSSSRSTMTATPPETDDISWSQPTSNHEHQKEVKEASLISRRCVKTCRNEPNIQWPVIAVQRNALKGHKCSWKQTSSCCSRLASHDLHPSHFPDRADRFVSSFTIILRPSYSHKRFIQRVFGFQFSHQALFNIPYGCEVWYNLVIVCNLPFNTFSGHSFHFLITEGAALEFSKFLGG